MKTIRFRFDYIYSRKGDVIEEGDGVAEILIQRGIAEEVAPDDARETPNPGPPAVQTRRVPGPRDGQGGGNRPNRRA